MDPLPCFHKVSPFHSVFRKTLFCSSGVIGALILFHVMYPQLSHPMGAAPAKESPPRHPQGHPQCHPVRLAVFPGQTGRGAR